MKHFLPIFTLSFFFSGILLATKIANPPKSASSSIEKSVTVSVSIGEPILNLYGYTSSLARVELEGNPGVKMETQARKDGYYRFTGVFLTSLTKELCVTSYDQQNRQTVPTCISAPGVNFKGNTIGPVILPPTISLSKGIFLPEETVEANGQSIPNSEISVSLFRAEPTLIQRIVRKAFPETYASALPMYIIKTDQNGNFSFNLPSTSANTYRLFTQTTFYNSPSPKSNTLTFRVLSTVEYFIEIFKNILRLLMNWILNLPIIETLIIVESLVLIFLFLSSRKKTRSITLLHKDILIYGQGKEMMKISN